MTEDHILRKHLEWLKKRTAYIAGTVAELEMMAKMAQVLIPDCTHSDWDKYTGRRRNCAGYWLDEDPWEVGLFRNLKEKQESFESIEFPDPSPPVPKHKKSRNMEQVSFYKQPRLMDCCSIEDFTRRGGVVIDV